MPPVVYSVHTASILARIVSCSFLFPNLLICKNASTPYPSRLCNSRLPAQYSAYTLLKGNPMPSLRFGGLELKLLNELSCVGCGDDSSGGGRGKFDDACGGGGARSSWSVAAILGTWWRFSRRWCFRGPLLKDQRCGRMSRGIPPPWSETRIITCCCASQTVTSIGGTVSPLLFRSTVAWMLFRSSSPMMYSRCERM